MDELAAIDQNGPEESKKVEIKANAGPKINDENQENKDMKSEHRKANGRKTGVKNYLETREMSENRGVSPEENEEKEGAQVNLKAESVKTIKSNGVDVLYPADNEGVVSPHKPELSGDQFRGEEVQEKGDAMIMVTFKGIATEEKGNNMVEAEDVVHYQEKNVLAQKDDGEFFSAELKTPVVSSAMHVSIMSVDYGEAEVDYEEAEVDFEEAEVDYGEVEVEYEEAEVDYGEVEVNYGEVENDSEEAEVDYEETEVDNDDAEVDNEEAEIDYEDADEVESESAEMRNIETTMAREEVIRDNEKIKETEKDKGNENTIFPQENFDELSETFETAYQDKEEVVAENQYQDYLTSSQRGQNFSSVSQLDLDSSRLDTESMGIQMVTTLTPTIRQTTTTSTIVNTSTTTQLTTTAPRTVASSSPGCISPGCKHLSSTLSTSSSPCTDLPRHLCSNLTPPPPPPPHLLVTSNLTKESMEQQLLSSCIATGPSTNLREVVRAVLERLPWTDQSSLRDKSAILATAFSIMPIIAGLESFKLDNKMLGEEEVDRVEERCL